MTLQAIHDIPCVGIEVKYHTLSGLWFFRPKGWTLFWTQVPSHLVEHVEEHVPSANT